MLPTMRTLLPLLLLTAACGAPFEAANPDLVRPDAEAPETAAEAGPGRDGQPGPEAAADAQEAGVDGPVGHDSGPGNDAGDSGSAADADGGPSCTCTGDLSNVGLGDFEIAFTVATTAWPVAPGYMAILNQRSECDPNKAGWDVGMNANGTLSIQVFDGSNVYDNEQSASAINDGQEHRVRLSRVGGATIRISIDGALQTFAGLPVETLAGTLATLQTGVDPTCASSGSRPAEPLAGVLTMVCVGPC